MPEQGRGHQIRPVRKGLPDHRAEEAVVDREGLRQRVVERQIVLRVEAHRVVVGGGLDAVVGLPLRGGVVLTHEPIGGPEESRRLGMLEEELLVTAFP